MDNCFHSISSGGGSRRPLQFFDYWNSLGFFDSVQVLIPPQFLVLFEIARVIFSGESQSEALSAVNELTKTNPVKVPDREQSILINRIEKTVPLSDKMEIGFFKTIYDLKKALPKELAWDSDIFNAKLLMKTLMIQKHYQTETDHFSTVSTHFDSSGNMRTRCEQKIYLLLDRSRSMDFKLRSFFSKCIIAEFLRRKFSGTIKLYYRPFDTKVGRLTMVEKREDFPVLINRILLTTTAGTSTNMQTAIMQAIQDINYEKDMADAEILVVTDGLTSIDKHVLKNELGAIKLNILKIGREGARPNAYYMMKTVKRNEVDFDPTHIDYDEIQQKIKTHKSDAVLTANEKRAFRYIQSQAEGIIKDIRDVSHRFIEIADFDQEHLFQLSDDSICSFVTLVDQLQDELTHTESIDGLTVLYKKAYFLGQYLQMLYKSAEISDHRLKAAYERLKAIRKRILENPTMFTIISGINDLDEDKNIMKVTQQEVQDKLQTIEMMNRGLSNKELKKVQMMISKKIQGGKGIKLLRLLLMKLIAWIEKKIAVWRKSKPA